jgi:hypothetical protein
VHIGDRNTIENPAERQQMCDECAGILVGIFLGLLIVVKLET